MRFKLFLLSLFATLAVCAQNQRGMVRTIGTSSHHGVPVSGATIKVKGNNQQYLSDSKGAFSLSMRQANAGDKFQLLNVTKLGYELADKDFLNKTFAYSPQSLLEIVLLSTEEMEKEKQAIEDRVFRIAKDNFEKKLAGLKQEQEQGLITAEDYRTKLKTLQDQYDIFDEILSAMAEHYARTDYDRLDSLDVLINTHIINGELDEADMLVAQKGNLDDRIAAYQRHAATNAAAREMLDKLTDELREQRIAYEKERDDIANDLYNKHSIAISRFDFDQALEMLKLRADLDTTNMKAVGDYAVLCYEQKKFEDCEKYYLVCLRAYSISNDLLNIAASQNNLGALYSDLHDYATSEKYYKLALENQELLFNQNPDAYREDLAMTQNNLGILYSNLHDYANNEKYFKLALENQELLFNQNPDAYRANLATTQNNLGALYSDLNDYTTSEKYYKLALENRELLFSQNPDAYRADLAMSQNNLGILYSDLHDYVTSEKYYKLALENRELLFNQNPDAYRADLACTQNSLGFLYYDLNDYATCEKYYKLALENREYLFHQNPDAYRADLATTQNNLGNLYRALHDYDNSEKYYKLALANRDQLFHQNPDAYRADLATTQNKLGNLYRALHDYDNSEKYYKFALANRDQLFNQNPDAYRADLATTQNNLGNLYSDLHDYVTCEKYYKLALENREQLFNQNPDAYRADLAMTQHNLGKLYNNLHDYASGEKYYKLALENYEELFHQNPDAYRASLAMICWNMMLLYADMDNAEEYDKYLALALDRYSILFQSQPSAYIDDVIELQNRTVWRLLVNGDVDEAIKLAKTTCSMDESNKTSKFYLAECYNSLSLKYANSANFDNAYACIDKAIEMLPDNPNFYDTKGEILLMQGRNDEALAIWKKVLELDPNFLDNYPDGTNLSNGLKERGLID